ncbi:MAG: heptaprenyl diphosphate synthase component 1 [Alicyclobacillus sp.]|nr:heptaprenyl diphosphate synthase component 1 [Alicyclobacillus sp.]
MAMSVSEWIPFEEMEQFVLQFIDHPFLRASQIQQSLSRFHFDVACAILKAAGATRETSRDVIAAVLLLYQGLSIHDDVGVEADVLRRQLVVLAGDYDSSQYYWLLARLDNPVLLTKLCEAVVQINEAKMRMVLEAGTLSDEDFFSLQDRNQGALLFAVADTYLHNQAYAMQCVRDLVHAYVVKAALRDQKASHRVSARQAYAWLSEALSRMQMNHTKTRVDAMVPPLLDVVNAYLLPMREELERRVLVEGKR